MRTPDGNRRPSRPVGAPDRGPARRPGTFKQIAKISTVVRPDSLTLEGGDRPEELVRAPPSSGPRSSQSDRRIGLAQVYARQGFQGLSTSFAQLFAVQLFKPATIWRRRRRDWNGRGRLRFGPRRAQNPRKRTESFAWRNERFRIAGRKSLESLPAKSRRFARSFVFNNLTGFSFRLFRGLRSPTPKAQLQPIVKRRSGSASHRRAVLRGRSGLDLGLRP